MGWGGGGDNDCRHHAPNPNEGGYMGVERIRDEEEVGYWEGIGWRRHTQGGGGASMRTCSDNKCPSGSVFCLF